jgi:hypothetical protein
MKIELRDYQKDAVDSVLTKWGELDNLLGGLSRAPLSAEHDQTRSFPPDH